MLEMELLQEGLSNAGILVQSLVVGATTIVIVDTKAPGIEMHLCLQVELKNHHRPIYRLYLSGLSIAPYLKVSEWHPRHCFCMIEI